MTSPVIGRARGAVGGYSRRVCANRVERRKDAGAALVGGGVVHDGGGARGKSGARAGRAADQHEESLRHV